MLEHKSSEISKQLGETGDNSCCPLVSEKQK